jgi:hypothetical protein
VENPQVYFSCLKIGFAACFDACFLKKGDITSELREVSSSVNSSSTRGKADVEQIIFFLSQ